MARPQLVIAPMPILRLTPGNWGGVLTASDPSGSPVPIFRPQFRCLIRLPNALFPKDALIDTGAPLTCFPERIWNTFRVGTDFEWLSLPPGALPTGTMSNWQYTFRLARFLVPLALLDYTTAVDRPGVIASFATSNPPTSQSGPGLPAVVVGLWGGLLEGSRLVIGCDPASGQVTGDLEFP